MWTAIRRFFHFFTIGFIVAFVIYLFVRWDVDKVIVGVVIGAAGGVVLGIAIFLLERRFPEKTPNDV
ncbi:MAG: hypothetical protein IT304_12045 [Dehalococcoidia bacterium]|nr:hypothetical protein [Dehalococcoidia bacterium]